MQTITCHVCGKTISSKADICPGCGHNHKGDREWQQRKIGFVIGAILLLVLFVILVFWWESDQNPFRRATHQMPTANSRR